MTQERWSNGVDEGCKMVAAGMSGVFVYSASCRAYSAASARPAEREERLLTCGGTEATSATL